MGRTRLGGRRDVGLVHYNDAAEGLTRDFAGGYNAGGSTTFNVGKAVDLQPTAAGLPYIAGQRGYAGNDWMLALKYRSNPSPAYAKHWAKWYDNGGFDEGRAVVVRVVDGGATNFSVYIVGTSFASGHGRDFCVWRYRE